MHQSDYNIGMEIKRNYKHHGGHSRKRWINAVEKDPEDLYKSAELLGYTVHNRKKLSDF